jgi:phosphate starvation-inducible protein PhoH
MAKHYQPQHFQPKSFSPITRNQKRVFDYFSNNHLVLHGMAGTGKSFLSLYLSIQAILAKKSPYLKIVVVRSAVPTRDIGFLPGSLKEKIEAYEEPYKIIVSEIFGRGDAYGILKNKGQIEFVTTSYLRGITLDDCIVIVDEFQNCTFQELDTIITRIGENGKIIFSGDYRQSDLDKSRERAGMIKFLDILEKMYEFEFVEFGAEDIVRSGLVKSYIIAKSELEDQLKNSA